MSKERLEEMEELLNEYYENIDDPFASTDNAMAIVDKVGYFVNRVQELEEESYNAHLERLLDRKEQQNKRYREAVGKAIEMISDSTGTITKPKDISLYDAWEIKNTLLEVLEGEE